MTIKMITQTHTQYQSSTNFKSQSNISQSKNGFRDPINFYFFFKTNQRNKTQEPPKKNTEQSHDTNNL